MPKILHTILAMVLVVLHSPYADADADFATEVKDLEHQSGLIDAYVDHDKARVLLALDRPDAEGVAGRYIYAAYLTGGLGSNPMGLDRSVPRGSHILAFKRIGGEVVAMIENHRFTASADNPAEKKAVRTSFASSIIWATDIIATDDATGKLLIDISDFLMRDAVGVSARLKARKQGTFSLARDRSFVKTEAAFMFPLNGEFDAYLTFKGSKPGPEVRTTTPVPEAVTLIAHTTFMKLPEAGYQLRQSDERAGVIDMAKVDMSAPLAGDTVVRLARRFRLEKDANGKVKKPIVFYIDNGAPEPIQSALLEGANWWADAFEAAGYPGGYRAEILPEGVHPLDARYNVVNWVHRATRGWSYGASIYDPRTGEILRGVVLLGSLRVRQDIKIFEALAGAGKTGTGAVDDPVELALARIRQLSAHEIGHSLGFSHNMAASTYGDRASVMDYPAPDVRLGEGGALDFSQAYGVGVGSWDKWVATFLYSDYGNADDTTAQAALVASADADGLLYVSDGDSRSVGSGHAKGALWDTGSDPVASLLNTLEVRRIALENFSEANLRKGESMRALQTKFVPLYLYHRYQLQAAAKSIGGAEFTYRHQGDSRAAPSVVPWARQQAALDALLATLTPEALDIDAATVQLLSPLGYSGGDPQFNRETFKGAGRPMFDRFAAARVAASLSFDALLHPARLARLSAQQGEDHPGLQAVLSQISDAVMVRGKSRRYSLVRQLVVDTYVERLIDLAQGRDIAPNVRRASRSALLDAKKRVARTYRADAVFAGGLVARIDDALARARTPAVKEPAEPVIPPGSPIGSGAAESCWHCEPGLGG